MSASLGFGFRVGHWTEADAMTGCTVVLPPPGNVTSCDIRGSSPGSRELALLDPERRLTEVQAILLTGGSAFGLAAADGAVAWLAERGLGYRTRIVPVPIVVAAVVFDLAEGRSDVRPGPEAGRAACDAAHDGRIQTGRVGAGAGVTVGKWAGREAAAPGGLGVAVAEARGSSVAALAVVNSVGDVVGDDGSVLAGSSSAAGELRAPAPLEPLEVPGNTVLAVVCTRGRMEKRDAQWLAARGSDGITVSVRPAHTRYDGDVVFASVAPGDDEVDLDVLGALATQAVAGAVRNAVAG
jgi:L-aminopeptidase/D-esterase-like protein